MKTYQIVISLLICFASNFDSAQADSNKTEDLAKDTVTATIVKTIPNTYNDSIALVYTNLLAKTKEHYANWSYSGADTLTNPYYYKLFFLSRLSDSVFTKSIGTLSTPSTSNTINRFQYMNDILTRCYAENPNFISNIPDAKDIKDTQKDSKAKEKKADPKPSVKEKAPITPAQPEPINEFDQAWSLVVKKPNFWNLKSSISLQFLQTYISSNWYRGGSSFKNLLATWNVEANYDNKRGFKVDNKVEMRLGFQTDHNDEVHRFKTHSDQVRMTNKLGLKATKNWYYTILLQSWTQFYKGYRANDKKVYSDFMSPFESVLSVGMDYNLRIKNFEFNTTLSPFAGKLKYCDRKALVNNYGLRDKHSRFEFGSNISGNFKWSIHKNIQWSGRIYYFTDYKKAQIEWENTIQFRLNKYLSTKLYLYPRFDDSANRKPGKNYFQFYEQLTFGVDLSF